MHSPARNWGQVGGRWNGQHQPGPEYAGMMDPSGVMQYDSRATTVAHLPRSQRLAPQYIAPSTYSMAPPSSMSNMQPTHYHPANPFEYNAYAPPSPPLAVPFKQNQDPQSTLRVLPANEHRNPGAAYSRHAGVTNPGVQNHYHIKHETQPLSPSTNSVVDTKTVSSDPTDNEKRKNGIFETPMDLLMRKIQTKSVGKMAKGLPEAGYPSPISTKTEPCSRSPSPERSSAEGKKKRYICYWDTCGARFYQKTHLKIHQRKHTGERPYPCRQPGCPYTFSQLGNLKTHERRHTGERPFGCTLCGKAFAQKGNLRAHMKIHGNAEKFWCKLDTCTKNFSQLGNLKSHQNKFHADTVLKLTKLLAEHDMDEVPEEDREICAHFAVLYKNSCKGIKGRGVGRRIGTDSSKNPNVKTISSHYPVQQLTPPMQHSQHPAQLPLPVQQSIHVEHGLPHHGNYSNHYAMPRHAPAQHHMMRGGYDMFDIDQESMSVNAVASTTYQDDHSRGLAFNGRMY